MNNDDYFNNAVELYDNKDYIKALSIFTSLYFNHTNIQGFLTDYISKSYYQLYKENFEKGNYYSSYELLCRANEYNNNKNEYEDELKKVESLKNYREGQNLLYVEKNFKEALSKLKNSYQLYEYINEDINKEREFDIKYAIYEYCNLFYNDLNDENLLNKLKKEKYINDLLNEGINNCNDELLLSKLKKIKSKISSKFNLYHCFELESSNELDKAIEICKKSLSDCDEELKKKFKTRLSELYQLKGEKLYNICTSYDDINLLSEILEYYKKALNLIDYENDNYNKLKLSISTIEITLLLINANNFKEQKKYNEAYENYIKANNINKKYNERLYNSKELEDRIKEIEEIIKI